jgi:hypothetical protein
VALQVERFLQRTVGGHDDVGVGSRITVHRRNRAHGDKTAQVNGRRHASGVEPGYVKLAFMQGLELFMRVGHRQVLNRFSNRLGKKIRKRFPRGAISFGFIAGDVAENQRGWIDLFGRVGRGVGHQITGRVGKFRGKLMSHRWMEPADGKVDRVVGRWLAHVTQIQDRCDRASSQDCQAKQKYRPCLPWSQRRS